ncbi:MAG: tetratricopeptide repeat protein, partial [Bryobacteraceae bacterium]
MRFAALLLLTLPLVAQRYPERSLDSQRSKLSIDQQIAAYQKMVAASPANARYQNQLASAYIQKVRESTDFSYLDRASKIVESVLSRDSGNYEAMRLRSAIELEKHQFASVAEYSGELVKLAPTDPWNWGTLGDSLMELGQYEKAGKAYDRMLALRADQSSYNRAAYHRFVTGDAKAAIEMMQLAIARGSGAPENTAWCLVELGTMQFKLGHLDDAQHAYEQALAAFPNYHAAFGGLGRVMGARDRIAEAIRYYTQARAGVPLPDYSAALHELYKRSGNAADAKKQLDLIDLVDKLDQATGEKTNRMLALVYANQSRRLDRAMELVQAELKVRQDVYTFDALAWVLFKMKKYEQAAEASAKALPLGTP